MSDMPAIAAIVPTFNRKALLMQCLQALLAQSVPLWRIVVIDNASTDGTGAALREAGLLDQPIIQYTRLAENIGGAGGFAHGMQLAFDAGAEWFWLLDDDAMAEREALAALLDIEPQPQHVYGSSAVFIEGEHRMMCWPAVITTYNADWPVVIRNHALLPSIGQVMMLPFIGFFVSRSMVARIGFPDADFFLCADDVEYSYRVRETGGKMYLMGHSVISHPWPGDYVLHMAGYRVFCRRMAPERRYYETRNRIWIARRHQRRYLFTTLLPSLLFRTMVTLGAEKNPWAQLVATMRGIRDGLLAAPGVVPPR